MRLRGSLHFASLWVLLAGAATPSSRSEPGDGGVAAPGGHTQAVVEGRVALPKARFAPVVNKRYEVVTKGGVVAMNPPLAVVYLEGSFPKPASPPVAQMVQKDLTFVPLLLPVQLGTKVEFPNLDDTYHDVFSYSLPKRFDLGRYRPDERPVPSQLFDVAGLVTLRCDIHEHMRGLILVVDTPYFVITDADGHFRLNGLPPGHYVLKAWLDSKTTLERPVELKADTVLQVDFP
jgi:plastocyanin